MAIKKFPQQLILALLSLTLAQSGGRLAAQHQQAAKSLTVGYIAEERERNASLPTNLAWSPAGKSLSFVRKTPRPSRAIRSSPATEIWSIDATTGLQKLLVSDAEVTAAFGGARPHAWPIDEEDESARRRLLQSYAWAPDGHALLLATGASLAWFDLDAHSSRPIVTDRADLSNSQISPDGRFVSFLQDHTLWLANAATGVAHIFAPVGNNEKREGEPDWVYLHELGLHSAYWWSPDSSSIAWLETNDQAVNKYTLHSADGDEQSLTYPKPGGTIPLIRIFVQAALGRKPLQIDLGSSTTVYIPRVQWLPDNKHLAIERLSRDQKTLDLLLADAATGKARVILTEKDTYWINLSNDLHFLKDSHRFIWSSERSGYRHLYLYDLAGRQLAQLTQGNWEVNSLVGVDEAAGTVYFTATEASPLERQLYRVNLDGSGLVRITQESGTHDLQLSPSGNVFLDTWSDHATPPRQELLRSDGSRIADLIDDIPNNLATSPLRSVEFLTVKSHLGTDLNAWMMRPQDYDSARQYPVIFYVAGGPGEQIVRDAWGGDISLWFALMAQNGYIIFAIDNRGTTGRGHFFEEPIHLRFSATEMADVRDGVLYLRTLPWVDKTRIGICGWGYGGFLTLHGMLDRPLLFKAGFAGSPITDWHLYDAVFTERYLEDPQRNQDGWLSSSPLENAKYLTAPLMLAQATMDETVHQENAMMLLDELLDKGKYADILLFPDRRDLFEDRGARLILFQRLTDFFQKNL
ncbi:MAG: S9 family peptidase [Terracidiphilus sp.]